MRRVARPTGPSHRVLSSDKLNYREARNSSIRPAAPLSKTSFHAPAPKAVACAPLRDADLRCQVEAESSRLYVAGMLVSELGSARDVYFTPGFR